MNLLLVVPRYNLTKKLHYDYVFPLGLAYISAVLKKENYQVDCLNLNHLSGKTEDIINKKLDSKKYDFVCTGNNALGYTITKVILDTAKKHYSKPKTILGGPIITSEPDIIFRSLEPDYAVIGEGEETIIELLNAIKKGKDLKKVKGVIYHNKDGEIIKTQKRQPIKNLDSIPFPDVEGLGLEEQLKNMHTNYFYYTNLSDEPRVYSILTSRSCPFQCTFCYHDTDYRKRSIINVMKELDFAVKHYKIDIINIYDECFALNKSRLLEFCKEIKKLQNEISWDIKWTCQMRVETMNRGVLKMMKDSGCFVISYGFESFSPIVLKSMRKNITPKQIDDAFKETLKSKIAVQGNFIFGDVAETKETAKETLDYWKKNCKGQVNLTFIQPYPGSKIYQHCLRKGIIKDKEEFIKNNITGRLFLNMTDGMTDKEIASLKKEMINSLGEYSHFTRPISLKKTGENVYSVKVKCPFCKEVLVYKNCLIENKWSYRDLLVCRNCFMRFLVVSFMLRIVYAYYSKIRTPIEFYLNFRNSIMKKRI